jgi:hypothetical protein
MVLYNYYVLLQAYLFETPDVKEKLDGGPRKKRACFQEQDKCTSEEYYLHSQVEHSFFIESLR